MSTRTDDRLEVLFSGPAQPEQSSPAAPEEAAAAAPEEARSARSEAASAARPTFTITEAAGACGVSRKTITRKLADLAGHGAAKDEDGIWRIPVEALLAAGLHPGRSLPESSRPRRAEPAAAPAPSTPRAAPAPPADPDVVTVPRQRWDDLRIRLARAEAEAAERSLALADARLALRALTAGPATAAPVPPAAPGPVDPPGFAMPPGPAAAGPAAGAPAAPPVTLPADPAPRRRRWWRRA